MVEESIAIASLSVSPSAKRLLRAAGFRTLSDVLNTRPMTMATDLGMQPDRVIELLDEIKKVAQRDLGWSPTRKRDVYTRLSSGKHFGSALATYESDGVASNSSGSATPKPGLDPDKDGAIDELFRFRKEETVLTMLLDHDKTHQTIVTFCEALDQMLGGGVATGEITEFCGCPGAGKTQICIQLAVDACIPKVFGGIGGEAL